MVLLCIHGTKHEWRRIGWIADIAELLRANPRIAWDDVLAFAAEAGVSRMVRLGVLLATDAGAVRIRRVLKSMIDGDAARTTTN